MRAGAISFLSGLSAPTAATNVHGATSSSARTATRDVVQVKAVPILFARDETDLRMQAGDARLDVTTEFTHSPVCGAMQWFSPLASTTKPVLGFARSNAWSGAGLGVQWTQTDRKTSFVGRFAYGAR